MPGWPSWLGRETHRVNTIIARFLRHLEVAGSNPAPGTYFWHFQKFVQELSCISYLNLGEYHNHICKTAFVHQYIHNNQYTSISLL